MSLLYGRKPDYPERTCRLPIGRPQLASRVEPGKKNAGDYWE